MKAKLTQRDEDWTLVATSCVEAGVDLSFRTNLRERFSAASLIQVGGRLNRHGEGRGSVFDFLIDPGHGITEHPAPKAPAAVLSRLLKAGAFTGDDADPAGIVTAAMAEELRNRGTDHGRHDPLLEAERVADYPEVTAANQVIDADTRLVVIDPALAERIERREAVPFRDLLSGSVQRWSSRIDDPRLTRLRGRPEIYRWPPPCDPEFLGVMAGILHLAEIERGGTLLV